MAFLKTALSGPTWSDCGHTLWRLYLHIYTCYQPTGISHSAVILKYDSRIRILICTYVCIDSAYKVKKACKDTCMYVCIKCKPGLKYTH